MKHRLSDLVTVINFNSHNKNKNSDLIQNSIVKFAQVY